MSNGNVIVVVGLSMTLIGTVPPEAQFGVGLVMVFIGALVSMSEGDL